MKLERMEDGPPNHHRGVGHTLKHYLAPAELWDDLATPAGLAPREVMAALGALSPPPHRQFKYPGAALRERWEWLCGVHREGYFAVASASVASVKAPPQAPWKWRAPIGGRRPKPAGYIIGSDDGVIIVVSKVAGKWEMRTAFRPGFCFDGSPLRSDPKAVGYRVTAAKHAARRRVVMMLEEVES